MRTCMSMMTISIPMLCHPYPVSHWSHSSHHQDHRRHQETESYHHLFREISLVPTEVTREVAPPPTLLARTPAANVMWRVLPTSLPATCTTTVMRARDSCSHVLMVLFTTEMVDLVWLAGVIIPTMLTALADQREVSIFIYIVATWLLHAYWHWYSLTPPRTSTWWPSSTWEWEFVISHQLIIIYLLCMCSKSTRPDPTRWPLSGKIKDCWRRTILRQILGVWVWPTRAVWLSEWVGLDREESGYRRWMWLSMETFKYL